MIYYHLPPSDAIFTNDGEEDEMVVPLFYSPAAVSWPVYNFFTTPKVPEPADLKAKPTIAKVNEQTSDFAKGKVLVIAMETARRYLAIS